MLQQGNCVKTFLASTSGNLEANAGESLLVRRVEAYTSGSDANITLKTQRVTVGFYRIKGKSGGHLDAIREEKEKFNMMEFLEGKGVNVALPVAEGEVFSFETTSSVDAVLVLFDRYDAGDILKTMPNGSESKEYTFMQYMNVGTGLSVSGNALFDTSLSPAEFPDFPCGKVVPANHKISLLGLIGCPWIDGQSTVKGFYATHIKLIKDREVLFDPDRLGLPFHCAETSKDTFHYKADYTVIGAGQTKSISNNSPSGDPLMFSPALEFESGEELNIYVACVAYGSSPAWTTTAPDLAAILKVVKT